MPNCLRLSARARKDIRGQRVRSVGDYHLVVAVNQTSLFVGWSHLAHSQASFVAMVVICVGAAESSRWKMSLSLKAYRTKLTSIFSGSPLAPPRCLCPHSVSLSWLVLADGAFADDLAGLPLAAPSSTVANVHGLSGNANISVHDLVTLH